MKRFILRALAAIAVLGSGAGFAGFADTLQAGKKLLPTEGQKIFTSVFEEKQAKMAELTREYQQLMDSEKEFMARLNANIDEVTSTVQLVKDALQTKSDDEFLRAQRILLDERYHVLNDKHRARERLVATLAQFIQLIQEFLNDPHFQRYAKELKGHKQGQYSFEDLHTINQLIVAQEKAIQLLHEQEKNANVELENRKKSADELSQTTVEEETNGSGFVSDEHQRSVLTALAEQLVVDQKERDELMLLEIHHKKSLIKTELFMARAHLDTLKEVFQAMKPAVQVSEADVAVAKDELAKKRQIAFDTKETYRRDIEQISQDLKEKEQKLTDLAKRYNCAQGSDLDDWSREPVNTIAGHLRFLECADLNDRVLLLQRRKDLLEAQTAFEDEKIQQEQVHIAVKETFYKINACKFSSDDEIKQEKKKYNTPKAETKANQSLIRERKSTAQNLLEQQKRALEHVGLKRKKIQAQRTSIFRGNSKEHTRCIELLNSAQESIHQQIDALTKLIGIYSDMIGMFKKTNKQIAFIRSELESISIWYRPSVAISWHGIAEIVPDLQAFFKDLGAYMMRSDGHATQATRHCVAHQPWSWIKNILKVAAALIIALGAWRLLPLLVMQLRAVVGRADRFRWPLLMVLMILECVQRYYWWIAGWVLGLFALTRANLADPYPYVLFFLCSIPYLLSLARRVLAFIGHYNRTQGYALWRAQLQPRILWLLSIVIYASIALTLFRYAFTLGSYHKSELPTILLALNIIIAQIALVMLITRDHLLALIPTRYALGQWLREKTEQYFYFIVLFIIVTLILSNPYIGFGKLVLFIVTRFLYMALVLPLLYWLHQFCKQAATHLFFHTEESGVLRERFAYAKTGYGLFMAGLFLSFITIGIILVAKLWGWPDTFAHMNQWSDFVNWLKTPILHAPADNPISVFSLIKIVGFLVTGFVFAYLINTYIFGRIFDVLLIEGGVQNTVTSLNRYLIIITALILGFQAVGLDDLVLYLIGALIVGIGWVIKDPIADVIAYFIILVQRPIKIGDYITLDEENKGVVRKITPRSVVIRRKNSTTIIVPNSTVIRKPLANWNYARGFTAFDDILVTVAYQADPAVVKGLLEKVLDASPFILKSPKPVVRLESFSEYGFVFMVRGYLSSNYTLDQWDIASDTRLEIVKILRQHNIQLAVPVHIVVGEKSSITALLEDKQV